MEDQKMEDQIWRKMEDRKMQDQLLGWKMQEQIITQSTTCTNNHSQMLKAAFAG